MTPDSELGQGLFRGSGFFAEVSHDCQSGLAEVLYDVGGPSVITSGDGERMDRDYNGARGIYLRALGDTSALRESLSACAASVASPQLAEM